MEAKEETSFDEHRLEVLLAARNVFSSKEKIDDT